MKALSSSEEIERLYRENRELSARIDELRKVVQYALTYSPQSKLSGVDNFRKRAPRAARFVLGICGGCKEEKQLGSYATLCDECRSRLSSERMTKRQADRKAEKDREKLGSDASATP